MKEGKGFFQACKTDVSLWSILDKKDKAGEVALFFSL